MLLQQLLEKIMRKKKFSKLVSSCQYYCLLGTVHTTSSAGGFDLLSHWHIPFTIQTNKKSPAEYDRAYKSYTQISFSFLKRWRSTRLFICCRIGISRLQFKQIKKALPNTTELIKVIPKYLFLF